VLLATFPSPAPAALAAVTSDDDVADAESAFDRPQALRLRNPNRIKPKYFIEFKD